MKRGNQYSIGEFFVFIGFICLLFSVSVSMLNGAQEDARLARARADILELKRMALVGSVESGDSISDITGRSCSACVCQSFNNECTTTQIDSFIKLSKATKGVIELSPEILTDPWGNPYVINETVGENNGICISEIFSAGRDKNLTKSEDNISVVIEEGC